MSRRIGVVTGGGDCPGLNAVIRAVAKASANRGWECIGVLGGYEGLLEPRRTIPLDYQILSGLLPRGGTILGTANRGRFSAKVGHGENRALPKELLEGVKEGMEALGLFALVSIGGDVLNFSGGLYQRPCRANSHCKSSNPLRRGPDP
jgi:6-phosphofructokinase 1